MHFQRFGGLTILVCFFWHSYLEDLTFEYLLYLYYRVVPIAMDRAIKEIVSGIVQRSVSIATQTTKELVLKVGISLEP